MAYSRKRSTGKKSYTASRRRAPARRRVAKPRARRSAPQTLRIVVEQSGPSQNPVDVLADRLTTPSKPRRARF